MAIKRKAHFTQGQPMKTGNVGITPGTGMPGVGTPGVGKQGTSAGKKKKSSGCAGAVFGFVLAVVLIIGIVGTAFSMLKTPSKKQCDQIISEFQTVCNDMNISGVIGCMKPSLVNTGLQLGTSFVNKEDIVDVFSSLGGIDEMGEGTGLDVEDLFEMMKLVPKRYGFPAKERKVTCKVSFGSFSQYVNVYVVKVNGDPYIAKLRFYKE